MIMEPTISITSEENNVLKFTMNNIHTSLANSLRRIILSEISTPVFRTFPHAESKVNIITNTTRFNNEILKQRIGCIPIHITDPEFPIDEYSIELNVKNDTDTIILCTTNDLKIKNITTDTLVSESATKNIFPPDPITGDYIPICRLRPKLSENLDGEQLEFKATLDMGNAKQDGMYNVVSTCSYGATTDDVKINDTWNEMKAQMEKNGSSEEEITFKKDNWMLLDAKRITLPNSFDYTIESVGVYSNFAIVYKACDIMINKCKNIIQLLEKGEIQIETNEDTTLDNEFVITFNNEDYTIGNPVVYFLYQDYYIKDKSLSFVGFKVPHPHIPKGVIRMAFEAPETSTTVIQYIHSACEKVIKTFLKIKDNFKP